MRILNLNNRGLASGLNQAASPEGAMVTATNVMCVRPGVLQPRPGFATTSYTMVPTSGQYTFAIHEYIKDRAASFLCFNYNPSTEAFSYEWDDNTTVTDSNSVLGPPNFALASPCAIVARENLYLNSAPYLKKFTSRGSATFYDVGRPPPVQTTSRTADTLSLVDSSSYNWLQPGDWVGYRWVFRAKDANDVIVRGAPTFATEIIQNTAAAARVVDVPIRTGAGNATVGDFVEIYRTHPAADPTSLSEDFYYVGEAEVYAVSYSSLTTFRDNVHPDSVGAEHYTNASRAGPEGTNIIPPTGTTMTQWRDSVWLGNITQNPEAIMALRYGYESEDFPLTYEDETVTPTGVGVATATCVSTAEIKPGMVLGSAAADDPLVVPGGTYASGTYVVSIDSATALTLSTNSLNGAACAARFFDVVKVKIGSQSVSFYAGASEAATPPSLVFEGTLVGQTSSRSAYSLARLTGRLVSAPDVKVSTGGVTYRTFPARDSDIPLIFWGSGIDTYTQAQFGEPLQIATSAYQAFNPPLPKPVAGALQYQSYLVNFPNRVRYSKPNQPEHFADAGWIDIGRADAKILRLCPLEDCLLVFKEDGIFRITGANGNWSVDILDGETFLCTPESVTVYGDTAYAWTNRGVVAVTVYEVSELSSPVLAPDGGTITQQGEITDLRYAARKFMQVPLTSDPPKGAYALTIPAHGLVIFAVPDEADDTRPTVWWVYSPVTRVWTTWDRTSRCATYSQRYQRVIADAGKESVANLVMEVSSLGEEIYEDEEYALGVTVTGLTFVKPANNWVPKVGDAVSTVTGAAYVTAYNSGSGLVTFDSSIGTGAQSVVAHETILCTMRWSPAVLEGPHVRALWRELEVSFCDIESGTNNGRGVPTPEFDATFYGENALSASLTDIPLTATGLNQLHTKRLGVPRAVGRAYALGVQILVRAPLTRWRLLTTRLEFEPAMSAKGVGR